MIPEDKIEPFLEVTSQAVKELYEELENRVSSSGDLVLFLENGHKVNRPVKGTPYVIGPGTEYHDDKYRIEFYTQYLKSGGKRKTKNLEKEGKIENIKNFERFSLFLELMIYSHQWENTKNLRELRQIACLLNGHSYKWELKIPEMGKSKFIDNKIKQPFLERDLKVGNLFDSIYFSQIRNAFAHSQFSFMPNGKAINFNNYDGSEFKNIQQLKIEDWEEIFLKSTLFFHEFLIMKENKRIEFGERNPTVEILIPNQDGAKYKTKIYWHSYGKKYGPSKPAS